MTESENRLQREKEAVDKLVAQIIALKDSDDMNFHKVGNPAPVNPPSTNSTSKAPLSTNRTGSLEPATQSVTQNTTFRTTQDLGQKSFAAQSVISGRSGSPSVTYRSSIYRSASPSKKVKDGVIYSNFSRSARFKDEKTDIPGVGHYQTGYSEFSPITVPRGKDGDKLGHTWEDVNVKKGKQLSSRDKHEQSMIAATARITDPDLSRSGPLSARSLGEAGPVSPGTVASNAVGFSGSGDKAEAMAAALIDSHHGDARAALVALSRRELNLRREMTNMRHITNNARIQSTHTISSVTNELENLRAQLQKKEGQLSAATARSDEVLAAAARAHAALSSAEGPLQEAVGILNGFPRQALTEGPLQPLTVTIQKALDAFTAAARQFNSMPDVRAGVGNTTGTLSGNQIVGRQDKSEERSSSPRSRAASLSHSTSGLAHIPSQFTGYSSLAAALDMPDNRNFGNLGASDGVVQVQNSKQKVVDRLSARSNEDTSARERPLTGYRANHPLTPRDSSNRAADIAAFTQKFVNGGARNSENSAADPLPDAHSEAQPDPRSEAHVDPDETSRHLMHIFESFGTRNSNGTVGLLESGWLAVVDAAGLQPSAPRQLVELSFRLAFHTVVEASGPTVRPLSKLPDDAALSYEQFIFAVSDFASRFTAFKNALVAGKPGNGGQLNATVLAIDPTALASVLNLFFVPLAKKMKQGLATPIPPTTPANPINPVNSVDGPTQKLLNKFSEEFLKPAVLQYFNEFKAAFQAIYKHYSSGNALTSPITNASVIEFGNDFKIIPSVVSSDELAHLANQVAPQAMGYPEFVELIGLLAYVTASGVAASANFSMVEKLHYFMLSLVRRQAMFPVEAGPLIQAAASTVGNI